MSRYGYIGLGQMGSAMVEHLLGTGADVVVFDLNTDAVVAAAASGATVAGSAAEVAGKADIISICVPAAHHIEAVLGGPDGVGTQGRTGQVIFIHSTVLPATIHAAAATAAAWGGIVHDACVAGGADAARLGELVILGGGLADLEPKARALLDVYGSKVIDGGPVGGGAGLKLGVNIMTYAQFAASAASFDLAANVGADSAALVEAWRHIGQLGKLTEPFLSLLSIPPEHVQGAIRDGLLATVDIAEKDLGLAAQLCTPESTRRGVVMALHDAMPEVFGVAEPSDHGGSA